MTCLQVGVTGSVLCLSVDHSSFYVGYSFSGAVHQYAVDTGLLVSSAQAHSGDVVTMTVIDAHVLCTSDTDGQVRLLDMTSGIADAPRTPSADSKAAVYSSDEMVYRQMCDGVLSLSLVALGRASEFMMLICSDGGAPRLITLYDALTVQSLGSIPSDDVGV